MTEESIDPQRGEIWLVRFDPSIGSEIQKTRPGVIINENEIGRLNMRIVVPITSWKSEYEFFPWVIKLIATLRNGLEKTSGADASQLKSVSLKRFVKKLEL